MAELELTNGAVEPPRKPKVIKRYTNRKLYDTVDSRYVTLDEIAVMVKDGVEVQIVDNRSKEDLTNVTMAQIIFEEEKKTSRMPLAILRSMIRSGGDRLQSFIVEGINPKVTAIREGAENAVARVFKRGEERGEERAEERSAGDGHESVSEQKAGAREQASEFVRLSRQSLSEWQERLDERVNRACETVTGLPSLHREVQALRDKLAELERKLEEQK